jgi:hypothetical protein
MPKALVFSQPAGLRFQAGTDIPDNWSKSFNFSSLESEITSVLLGGVVFVFQNSEAAIAPSIVIQLSPNKLFEAFPEGSSRLEALKRAIDAGMMVFGAGGVLPSYWRPFAGREFMTFQALPISKGDARRLALWRRLPPAANPCVFIFDITEKQRDFDALNPDLKFLNSVLDARGEALKLMPRRPDTHIEVGPAALELEAPSQQVDTVIHGWKLGYLYESRLTKRQRDFVDADLDAPIRLKGAAGTGKTLAMVTKLLREAKARKESKTPYRFLFLTHNASAAELAQKYAVGLDEDELLSQMNEQQLIWMDTLLGLAIHDLSEDLGDLHPISNDAHEGKQLQLLTLSDIVVTYFHGAWITRSKLASDSIRMGVEAAQNTPQHEEFCWDVMNEIATVLDAEGVRDRTVKREAYLTGRRTSQSLMPLETITDRQVILDIYDRYRAELRRQDLISVDQLTADYLGFLDSNRWDARRRRLGYDAIFVDEFHLFSGLERLTFRPLLRNPDENIPIILMALDPRQSPRAVFLSVFGDEASSPALGPDRTSAPLARGQAEHLRDFEFSDVFRYTPEIANFLVFVNRAFPETDLAQEWLPAVASSVLPSAEPPTAHEADNRQSLYDYALQRAQPSIRRFGRGKVAILTLSHKAFQAIKMAGRFENKFYVVDSRDSLNRLQYVGGRVVLSMPEYVAGVQFDHVIVADVNKMDDLGRHTAASRYRFGSNLYLAASRACREVTLLGDRTAGGLAAVVRGAAAEGLVRIV